MNNFTVESESGEMVEVPQITNYFVDPAYFDLFGLTFVAGRGFSPDAVGDVQNQAVINETAARLAGLTNPVGKRIGRGSAEPMRIIGVVKDIHFTSFRSKGGLMFLHRPARTSWMFVKTSGRRVRETIAFVESTIRKHVPDFTYDYAAMEDIYDRLYETEDKLGGLLITMPPWKDAIDRITHWQDVLGELPLIIQGHCRMVIEGPAYATRYRREELEDIRAATALWAYRLGIKTKMVSLHLFGKKY